MSDKNPAADEAVEKDQSEEVVQTPSEETVETPAVDATPEAAVQAPEEDDIETTQGEVVEPSPEETQGEVVEDVPLGPHTTLNTFLRDGVRVEAGKAITFLEHEVEHVKDLFEAGAIFPGTGSDAREAVEAAEAEREANRNTPPTA